MDSNKLTVVLGGQWGDEGKGKLVDILAEDCDYVVRATGGANAGHTIYLDNPDNPEKPFKHIFHLVPSGMLNEKPVCVIGNGLVLSLPTMFEEIETLREHGDKVEGRLLISSRVHILFDYHKKVDALQEEMKGKSAVGTTLRGIGPAYTDKIRRNGIRMHELLDWDAFEKKYRGNLEMFKKMYGDFEYDADTELAYYKGIVETVRPMIVDSAKLIYDELKAGKKILVEGANGALLDIDHGTYPYVTSSNSTIGGICTGLGVGATAIDNVIGIMKAYTTRVGAGPFPSELHDDLGVQIREAGGEYGSTTGRPRRCGWFDAVVSGYSAMINGLTSANLTKLDVLTGLDSLKIATGYKLNGESINSVPPSLDDLDKVEVTYIEMPGWKEDINKVRKFEDLPENAQRYVEKLEELMDCPVSSIGVGVKREDIIFK